MFSVELKVPREKIEQEVLKLREQLVIDVDQMRVKLAKKTDLLDAEREQLAKRQQMIEQDSQAELDVLRQRVQQEAQEAGHQKGYDEGFAEGRNQGQVEFNAIKEDFIHHTKEIFYKIQELNEYKQAIFEKTEPYILSLIESIVKKVISVEMSIHPDLILDVIREAATRISDVPHLKVNVNPQHAQFLKENKDLMRNKIDIAANIEIVSNESLHPGGCQLEADYGLVDASVEIKMISIMELLNKVYDLRHMQPEEVDIEAAESTPEGTPEVEDNDDSLFSDEDDALLSFSDTDIKDDDLGFLTDDDLTDDDDDDVVDEDEDNSEDDNKTDDEDEVQDDDAGFLEDDEALSQE